jgi:hypothetical protein
VEPGQKKAAKKPAKKRKKAAKKPAKKRKKAAKKKMAAPAPAPVFTPMM